MQGSTPALEYAFSIKAETSPAVSAGENCQGERLCIPIIGGVVSSPKLSGTICPAVPAASSPVCLEVGCINLQRVEVAIPVGQVREYAIKNTQTAPSDKAIVECFMRAIFCRSIAPAKAIANDKDDPTTRTNQTWKTSILANNESDLCKSEKTLINRSRP